MSTLNDELYHYGVSGQKWGVRNTQRVNNRSRTYMPNSLDAPRYVNSKLRFQQKESKDALKKRKKSSALTMTIFVDSIPQKTIETGKQFVVDITKR